MRDRKKEVSKLLRMKECEVVEQAGVHLRVFPDCDGIHQQIAEDMVNLISGNNKKNKTTSAILPVGPTGQYPIFLDMIHEKGVSLKNCWFFFMDENAYQSGRAFEADHPLSFQGETRRLWLDKVDPHLMIPENQLFFPDQDNVHTLARKITDIGGIDICFGGIGVHGHLAFNEPEPEVSESDPRLVYLNDYTVTINAIRAKIGGNLEAFPRKAYTLGMRQILGTRKLRFVCRNGIELDWANTVLRLSLFGVPGDDYPCSYINQHSDYIVYTDQKTLRCPEILL